MEREEDLYAADADVEGEDTPDPLAELPEDPEQRRQQIDAYLATERERIAAEAKTEAEAEVQRHKAEVNSRAKERLLDRFGIEWGDDGEFAVKDPLRALSNLQAAAPPPVTDERPDPVYDPEGHAAWVNRQIEQKATEANKPLLERLGRMEAMLMGQTLAPAEAQAREVLEGYNLGQFADHPEFQTRFQQALNQLPFEQRQNPQALALAAFSVVPFLDQGKLPKQPPPQDPDTGRFTANPSRAGLAQAAPPRGYGRQAASGGYTAEQRTTAEAAGMSVEEFVAYSSEETAWEYQPKGRR